VAYTPAMRYLACGVAIAAALCFSGEAQTPAYDVLIAGGTIVVGSGAGRRPADVAIKDGRLVSIGRLSGATAAETIDAKGFVVAPGFIDVHTHADGIVRTPDAENFVRMGVTSVVAGNCGGSALDIGEALTNIRQTGTAINFATLVGHNTVRRAAMGNANRAPTVAELARMKSLVWKAMADGAVGFSTGLEYVPGTYAKTSEILELARVAANAGGLYASHMRDEGRQLEAPVA
jgi:N-acyl-D-amino-acid deacylase